eukprot:m.138379 g.138379  ORF g.138379 m.138379 type:complete len:81 (-) comp14373_c0_seq1:485-727(-)
MPMPAFLAQFNDNKIMIAITTFFLARTIATNLSATGAFEIFVDGELVWSKLETGRVPQWNQILEALSSKGIKLASVHHLD